MKRDYCMMTAFRVGYDGVYYVTVPDHAAGLRKRFTVYVVPASPSRRVRVIGRELPEADAARIVAEHARLRARLRARAVPEKAVGGK